MPIYAYRCAACGHAQDVLQKLSDPLLTRCPVCGAEAFQKQLTAAGFQLKGSGWYVTDFRDGKKTGADAAKPADAAAPGDAKPADAKPAETKAGETKPAADKAAAPAPAPAAPAPPPSSSSGS